MLEIVANLATLVTGIGAAWVVWLGLRLKRQQRADSWLTQLNELHKQFWDDPDFATVRRWLASDKAYEELRAALDTRFTRPAELSAEAYQQIEILDKFVNFLIRVRLVDSNLNADHDLWTELSFHFWFDAIADRGRWHIVVYLQHFFPGRALPALPRHDQDPELEQVWARLLRSHGLDSFALNSNVDGGSPSQTLGRSEER
jgi:hypothetical protein